MCGIFEPTGHVLILSLPKLLAYNITYNYLHLSISINYNLFLTSYVHHAAHMASFVN